DPAGQPRPGGPPRRRAPGDAPARGLARDRALGPGSAPGRARAPVLGPGRAGPEPAAAAGPGAGRAGARGPSGPASLEAEGRDRRAEMITLKRLNGAELVLNAELIEVLEPRGGETVVCLATGNKYDVSDTAEEISRKVIEYRKKVNSTGQVINPIRGFERENP